MSENSKFTTFPSVFLTLISIVIALGIEQLLGHVSVQFAGAAGATRFLIVVQGVTMFLVVGAIWIAYATQVMTSAWEPRFQDFFLPLLILALLYFAISAVGTAGPTWFYLVALGWAMPAIGHFFNTPGPVAARLKPNSTEGRRVFSCVSCLCLLATAGGITTQLGALVPFGAAVLVSAMAVIQLLAAWLLFRWWRAA